MIYFFVPGVPITGDAVVTAANQAMRKQSLQRFPRESAVALTVMLLLDRPPDHPDYPVYPPVVNDSIDSIGRVLTGMAWVDAAQVTDQSVFKRYIENALSGEVPGAHIYIEALPGFDEVWDEQWPLKA